MDLAFSPEQQRFREELRSWLEAEVKRPWAQDVADPAHDADALVGLRSAFQRRLNDAGYLGMDWPTEWGGRGASVVEKAIFQEEMRRCDAPPIPNALGLALLGPALIHHGSEAQRRRFIPKMLTAEEIWCQGFSEPGAGSDLASLRTRAEAFGDDFRITGQKVWTTFGPWADWIFVLARTDPDDRYGGISFFLVPLDQPEIVVRPLRQITGEAEFGEVFFDGALARREHLVGAPGEGWKIAMTVLSYERGATSLADPAKNDRFLDDLIAGLDAQGRLGDRDVREKVGRLLVENEVMRANGYRTMATLASGDAPGPESSLGKLVWSEYAQRQADVATELLGMEGQIVGGTPGSRSDVDWPGELLWSRAGTIYSGSSEIQRNIIAKRALRLPTR